eukprot:8835024-Pyramimonas_sp.AAC.1
MAVVRHKEAVVKVEAAHAETVGQLEQAAAAHRAAHGEMDTFDPSEFRRQIVADEQAERDNRDCERRAAADARGPADPGAGAVGPGNREPGGADAKHVDDGPAPAARPH